MLPWIVLLQSLFGFGSLKPWQAATQCLHRLYASTVVFPSLWTYDLLEGAPVIPAGLARNAREMILLRILEVYVARRHESRDGASSRSDCGREIDHSRSCEDVARGLMQEIVASNVKMDNSEMLKWDIRTFIRRKRASFPKCTLLRLKDAILGGNNPGLASLEMAGKSGLSISNKSARGDVDAVTGLLEGSCRGDQTLAADGLMRDDNDLNTNDLAGQCEEDHVSMEIGHGPRLRSSYFTGQDIGQKYGLRICSEHAGDLDRKNG
ncbi:uncharacterized protein LOC127798079 [Diospyros lotus]|uniref:uncharacterized protein LOC127798079 n=1 Tax=Diospyros lotus TaxID=55363 RepID=UPI00225762F8|nr:uncharacterized protein LOC127798079 [Diospyros lotus]